MSKFLFRLSYGFILMLASAIAAAGTLEVSSPTDGAFVGTTNTISFIARGATLQVTVKAVVTGPGGSFSVEQQFTPNAQGEVTGTLPLNFSASNPQGSYTIVVTATEPGNTYNSVTINVTLDTQKPKVLDFNPLPGAFVKGTVPINIRVNEPNVREMRVQVNGQDIPNNTTDQDNFTVMWDTSGIELDGPQTITIKIKDKANNEITQEIAVTLDRVSPATVIQFPRSDTPLRRGGTISVVIDVVDAQSNSISPYAVDVLITRMDGSYLGRVTRTNTRNSGNKLTWSGRIRWQNSLPNTFKIVANAVDKAGNVAATQEVTVTIR